LEPPPVTLSELPNCAQVWPCSVIMCDIVANRGRPFGEPFWQAKSEEEVDSLGGLCGDTVAQPSKFSHL
jgi:hypothetical protein